MIKNFKFMSSTFIMAVALAAPQLSHAMDPEFLDTPKEVWGLCVKQAAYEQCLEEKTPVTLGKTLGNLAVVCVNWKNFIVDEMQVGTSSWKAWYGVTPKNEDIYQQFLNGILIYRPNPQSDEGIITLKISELLNPLSCTFDLSTCGDRGQYLSISTGYRKGKKQENSNKLEIWLAPKFIIEKNLQSSAGHLQSIMGNWNEEIAPIGIFWTFGEWSDLYGCDYLNNIKLDDICSKNIFEHWLRAKQMKDARYNPLICQNFTFICKPK
ncbi:MAG: hypothetical protein H0X26_07240 [Alphaproteobacteria bacterium]|nr:hypothetical protein [Alphaproteobacteria bacterium]